MTTTFLGKLTGDAWHEARAGRVGGSDLGAIIGHGYVIREQLLAEKRGGTPKPEPTAAMRRGHYAEMYLREWLLQEKAITCAWDKLGTYHGDDYAVINPDDVTTDGQVVEYKMPCTRAGFGRAGTDQIPPGFLAQVTWACGWLGLDRWLLAVHSTKATRDGSTFDDALYRGRFNAEFFAFLCREARQFHHDIHLNRKAAA